MPHTYDIFISYGHLDDEDPGGDVKGWVDLLVERLPRLVSNNLGYMPAIWRDQRSLHGNDLLTAAISEGVTSSLLLIPIVSPRYVQSDWCLRELEAFCHSEVAAGAPSFKSRIFKVIKTPLLFHFARKEPEALRELIGYSFYEMEGDMPVEYGPEVTPTKDPRYWTALRRLAWDVSNMLVTLKHPKGTTGPLVSPTAQPAVVVPSVAGATNGTQKSVYLAETTSDLTSERDVVRDELRQRGYAVLPEAKLPSAELPEIQTAVNEALQRCVLSVHLIGKRYGSSPEDDPRSLVCIQENLAAQHCASHADFLRLLWMPPGLMTPSLEVSDERQKQFITDVQNRIGCGAELLQTTIEDLKTRIVEKLTPPVAKAAAAAAPRTGRSKLKQVYLICENRDRTLVRPLKEYLFKQNIEVITWTDGEGRELMEYHQKNLRECDAALVYFGNGDEPWVRKNLEDLEKAYGYGREEDWSVSAVYVGAPQSEQKEDFLTHLVPYVIRNYQSFDPNDLRDFVAAVHASEGEQR